VGRAIAQIRGLTVQQLAESTTQNCLRLFSAMVA